jgi:hypothetical protein
VRFHARLHPGKLALEDIASGRHWTYQALDRYAAACTALLLERGFVEGDRLACLSRNRADVIVLQLAYARLGAIFVPLNWRLSDAELRDLIADCEPRLLFSDDKKRELGLPAVDIVGLSALSEGQEPCWPEQCSADMPSLMLYTSGTPGQQREWAGELARKSGTRTAAPVYARGDAKEESVRSLVTGTGSATGSSPYCAASSISSPARWMSSPAPSSVLQAAHENAKNSARTAIRRVLAFKLIDIGTSTGNRISFA